MFDEQNKICPICSGENQLTFIQKATNENGEFSLWQCGICASQFWQPFKAPGASWYETGDSYNPKDPNKLRQLHAYHWQFLQNRNGLLGKKIIDLGCGTGEFLAELIKRGAVATGTDLDSEAIAIAKNYHGLGQLTALPIAEYCQQQIENSADIITSFEVIEHIDYPGLLLSEARRILKPGGLLAMSVPSRERIFANLAGWDYPFHHLSRFNEAAIRNLLTQHGFKVVKLKYLNKFLQLYEVFLEVIAKKLGFKRASNFKKIANEMIIEKTWQRRIKDLVIKIIYKVGRFVGVVLIPGALAGLVYPVSLVFYPRGGIIYLEAVKK